MQNGIITILIGVIIILLGILYVGNDFDFSNGRTETETSESVEESVLSDVDSDITPKSPSSKPTPTRTTSGSNTEAVSELQSEFGIVVVTYTDDGFAPPVIEVHAGDQVRFINRSSKALWVTADLHPTAKTQNYPEFDQGKTISNGGSYTFVFTKIGVWGYKNLNDENHLGAVSVIAQN